MQQDHLQSPDGEHPSVTDGWDTIARESAIPAVDYVEPGRVFIPAGHIALNADAIDQQLAAKE